MSAASTHFLTTNFHLSDAHINRLSVHLGEVSGFIAGGAALYWQLGDVLPEDQDLDIWIPTQLRYTGGEHYTTRTTAMYTTADGEEDTSCFEYTSRIKETTDTLIKSFGYSTNPEHCSGKRYSAESPYGSKKDCRYDIPYHFNPDFQKVVNRICDYRHVESGRQIQVIYFYGNAEPLVGFDLDICKIKACPGGSGGFTIQLPEGMTADLLAKRVMNITNWSCPTNLERRVKKYYNRRFVLLHVETGEPLTGNELQGLYIDMRRMRVNAESN
jgi:hypothetical protein